MHTFSWAAAALVLLSACSNKVAEPDGFGSSSNTNQTSNAVRTRRAATVTIPIRSENDLKEKAAAVLRLFPAGSSVAVADVGIAPEAQLDTTLGSAKAPQIRVDYDPKVDRFLAIDVELAKVRDGVEVSEAVARQRLEVVVRSAVAAGIIGEKDYSLSDANVTPLMQGEGDSSGAPPVESVKEYRFFMPRKIDGIVLNDGGQRDLGLKVMIHRSGALAGLQVAAIGARVVFGGDVSIAVSASELSRRVETDFPSSTILPLGLRYSLNHPNGDPRQTYRVSLRTIIDGEVTNARAKTVYYSITDPSLSPEIWPTPNPDEKSDRPRRRESAPGSSGTVVE